MASNIGGVGVNNLNSGELENALQQQEMINLEAFQFQMNSSISKTFTDTLSSIANNVGQ